MGHGKQLAGSDLFFKNMALIFALVMALMILMNLKSSLSINVYNSIEPLGWVLTFAFAFLWLKSRVMVIGLLVITVYGNLQFWSVPLQGFAGPKLPPDLMSMLAPSVYLFGLGCLIMAQWPQFYPWSLVRPSRTRLWKLIVILTGLTLSMQYWGRI